MKAYSIMQTNQPLNITIDIALLFRRIASFIYFAFFISGFLNSQPTQKIKFSRSTHLIYFFQIGAKSDTLHKNKNDLFFISFPDTSKDQILIATENGQFRKTDHDTVIRLVYVPGLKYESYFERKEIPDSVMSKVPVTEFKTQVNGPSVYNSKKIQIQVIDRKRNQIIIENIFVVP